MSRWRRFFAALVACLAVVACTSGEATSGTGAESTTSTVAADRRPYAVGRIDLELVDASRPTAADPGRNLQERPDRTIPVLVLYPAEGEPAPDGAPRPDASPADGAFPLVVFSHGVTATADAYAGRIQRWAKAGYVVAAPTFPLTSGPGAPIHDYVNQPGDVHFVIDELLRQAAERDHPLHDHIDADRVAVAGHSLGASTTVGAAFNTCCAEETIDAAVEISGIELPFPGGAYEPWPDTPFLVIHGAADATLPVRGSDSLFEKSTSPSYYLRYTNAGHVDLLAAESGELVDQVVVAFLDRYLKDDPTGLDAARDLVAASGLATFAERGT